MDFKDLELPNLIDVHITNAAGEKVYSDDKRTKPVIISLHLPESEAMRTYDNKVHSKLLKNLNRRNSKKVTTSLEESRDDEVDKLVAFTADIKNFMFSGKELKLADVRSIYANVNLAFINKQLNERFQSYSDFLGE